MLRGFAVVRRVRVATIVISLIACVAMAGFVSASEATSTNYRLKQSTVNTGGAEVSSSGYVLNGSAAQEVTIGASSSPRFVLQSGFWSFLGSSLVPVVLAVEKNVVTPGNVDLSWSGNNAPYDVYEAVDCANVFASPFDVTSSNNYDDITPPVASLVCYSILATAPGPVQPPSE